MDKIGWKNVTLKDIAEWGSGGTPKSTVSQYYGGEIPWLTIGDLNDGYVTNSNNTITEDGLKNSSARLIDPGNVLVAMYGSIGKLGINRVPLTTNQAIAFTQKLHSFVHNRYLFFYLLHIRLALYKLGKGGTQRNISQTVLKKVGFPLAPLPEQRAIVAKIEQLFSDLDNGIANLKKVQKQLKIYRQAVLKKAFEGELVSTEAELARAEGRDYEPADVLLARILEERREKWNGKGKYKEPVAPDTSGLPELPEGWGWTTGDAIFWFVTSGSRGWAKYYSDSGPIFLRIGNLDHDSTAIDLSNIQRVQPPAGAEGNRTCIIVGDILISITADIGMIALVPEDIEEAYINQHVALARPVSTISPSYLAWFLSSQEGGQKQFLKLQRGATKMGLGLDDIRAVNVPLPPLPEQRRIVTELERRLSLCDKMEATITEALQKSEALRQSVLKRAFEGKLLNEKELEEARNAPDWEPADKLLERINAEKEKPGNKKSF